MMLTSVYLYQDDKNDRLREIYPVLQDVPLPHEALTRNFFLDWMRFKHRDLNLDDVLLPEEVFQTKDILEF